MKTGKEVVHEFENQFDAFGHIIDAKKFISESEMIDKAIKEAYEEGCKYTIESIIEYCHEAGHIDVKNALEEYLDKQSHADSGV
jgi:SOS response regulatory protein OraA/RecX